MSPKTVTAALLSLCLGASLVWAAPGDHALFRFFRQMYLFTYIDSSGEDYKVSPRAARIALGGEVFSSPVVCAARSYYVDCVVGCRDDHVYCLQLGCCDVGRYLDSPCKADQMVSPVAMH